MIAVKFSILKWSAWAPGIHSVDQWQRWHNTNQQIQDDKSEPALKHIPAMLRRRLGRLSKMSLQVVCDCVEQGDQLRTVFCSPHGEIHRTQKLLDDIVRAEAISPMGFSLSVHNTASGMYSIASGNQAASTAVAAGVDSLESAVIEAVSRLHQNADSPVLVVFADEPLPDFYRRFDNSESLPIALALLIDLPKRGVMDVTLSKSQLDKPTLAVNFEPHVLGVLRLLNSRQTILTNSQGGRSCWQWVKAVACD